MNIGERVTLRIEKPAAGGRMIARHEGAIVLVSGAIPGEVIDGEVEKVQRGTAWARPLRVVDASPDRVDTPSDSACGGNVFAHIRYERQIALKREIIRDAFARIGRLTIDEDFEVTPSRVDGYRMRARLHLVDGQLGFFREGTHELCDPAGTAQLMPATAAAIEALSRTIDSSAADQITEIELAENRDGDQRALHLVLHDDGNAARLHQVGEGVHLSGVSCGRARGGRPVVLRGTPEVTDTLAFSTSGGSHQVELTRQASAFFQANRYLLAPLVQAVLDVVPAGRVLDLYAGVGLFSVPLATRGGTEVIAIEGDRTSARDLKFNAARAGGPIETWHQAVEVFLAGRRVPGLDVMIVDPPRTGMTKDALRHAIALRSPRIVYVSCDVATLARDARTLTDAGYRVSSIRAFDLFPRTAHVETLAVFDRD